jgi:hypothetical protein
MTLTFTSASGLTVQLHCFIKQVMHHGDLFQCTVGAMGSIHDALGPLRQDPR